MPEPTSLPQNPLDRAEYVEQAYMFQLLRERSADQMPMQELLEQVQYEVLATTNLPIAVEYLLTELKHSGLMAPAMYKMGHYFTAFQSFMIQEAEAETGRFAIETALQALEAEAKYRIESPSAEGLFFFRFEVLCRNRLNYDKGLTATSDDPIFDLPWKKWILKLRAEIGLVDFADLLFFASEEYQARLEDAGESTDGKGPYLLGRKEGRIALGNRRKEPLLLFAAMQRHLSYPAVPRPTPHDEAIDLVPQLMRRVERLESRIKLMEEERRAGIDLTKFYGKDGKLPPLDE
ncbi:MAG: hypothetical protein AB8B91_18135 [Rubripirellula sp.]